uniref:Uncharacterized protein n=1 Tax=Siphoviridae sp. ctBLh2 TaxID=2827803 RepID=A0A8S5S3B8_9CAUD|nr:MAG TPA: hypothetical protein [Siphoviridae sp. ctBLh2]
MTVHCCRKPAARDDLKKRKNFTYLPKNRSASLDVAPAIRGSRQKIPVVFTVISP